MHVRVILDNPQVLVDRTPYRHMVSHVVVPPTNLFSFIFLFLTYFAWKIYGNTDNQGASIQDPSPSTRGVWDPHHQIDIRKLESVQRRAARFVLSRQHNRSSVTAMIQRLGWRTLEDRRRDARLTMLYKIDHELLSISKTDRLDRPTRRIRQSISRQCLSSTTL